MSKGNVNPVGVQEEQENNLIIPIFTRQLGEFFEVVQVYLPDIYVSKLEISLNERIYIVDKKISLKTLVNELNKIVTHKDYTKIIEHIDPNIILIDKFMNEDDP